METPDTLDRGCLHRQHLLPSRSNFLPQFLLNCSRAMADYKSAKEAFHADNPGSSVHYINLLSVTALVSMRCPITS